jgi:acetolactate synthase-1/2/3 large subunit
MMMVADVLVEGLVRAGTARVFAVADGVGVESLVGAVERRGLPVVRVSRSDVACVMAAVAGALDGAPGAAVVSAAGGDASAGLAWALTERAPAIVIVVGERPDGEAAAPAESAKAALSVAAVSAAHWIAHACQLAMTEPWGPVRLDLSAPVAAAPALPVATTSRHAPLPPPAPAALDDAVRWLEAAERPLVVVGRLCRSDADAAWVRAFAEARPAPVLVTPRARGVLPDPHPLVIGTLDAGDPERALLASADLVVAVGVDPVEVRPSVWPVGAARLTITPVPSDAPVAGTVGGDVGLIFEELAPRLRDRRLGEWDVARLHALKQAAATPPADPRELARHRLVEAARRLTPAGTIAVFDGATWETAARAWHAVAPGECLIASQSAGRPFAVAAAAAAQLARPERRVLCFTDAVELPTAGDQLETVMALGVPIAIVAVGDSATPATPVPRGLRRLRATTTEVFVSALELALGGGAPAVVEALVHPP